MGTLFRMSINLMRNLLKFPAVKPNGSPLAQIAFSKYIYYWLDAGYIHWLRGFNTGVFVGVCFHDYTDKIVDMKLPIYPFQGQVTALP